MFSNLHPSLRRAFYVILGVFACLFIATYHTFKVALSAPNDIVDKDYYQVGLNYEKQIATQRKFKEEGYGFTILGGLDNLQKGENDFQVIYSKNRTQEEKESIRLMEEKFSGKRISVLLERGATDRFNQAKYLQETAPGVYYGRLTIPESGKWILTIVSEEEKFSERKIIFVN